MGWFRRLKLLPKRCLSYPIHLEISGSAGDMPHRGIVARDKPGDESRGVVSSLRSEQNALFKAEWLTYQREPASFGNAHPSRYEA